MNNILRNVPMDEYRSMPGLSKHQFDKFCVAPALYKHQKEKEYKPSRAMEIGTLIHSLALEGRKDFAIGPQVDRRTTAGKNAWNEFCADNIGRIIVNQEEADTILGCCKAVDPLLKTIMYDPKQDVECSMFWERNAIACKGRPDIIGHIEGKRCIVDLKTTTDISTFDKRFFAFGYDLQAAWYMHALQLIEDQQVEFYFLVVDTESPHLCQFVKAGANMLAKADYKATLELEKFLCCEAFNLWPGLERMRTLDIKHN